MKLQQSAIYRGDNYGVECTEDIEFTHNPVGIYGQVKNMFATDKNLESITVLFDDSSGCEFKKVSE